MEILFKKPQFLVSQFNISQRLVLKCYYKDFYFLVKNLEEISLPKIKTTINLCYSIGDIPEDWNTEKIMKMIFESGKEMKMIFKADDSRLFWFYENFLDVFLRVSHKK